MGTAADKHHLGAAHKHVFCIQRKAALSFKGNSKQSKDGHEAKHDKKLPARVQKQCGSVTAACFRRPEGCHRPTGPCQANQAWPAACAHNTSTYSNPCKQA